ncbi:putative phosphatidylinositol (3,5) kinase [Leishmania major strain Friedlin]|uniref:Putative phosphatidylinositol (3,5) kinase n=1 Tax=Leishmania major TaxID=5664 RepID=E9AD66_LEIMA|nr:putative phosphatidylinositol (3,5) kinase [Leishmania major strain Friedlin]CAG9576691.1 phosphatidylinositol_(3_-5)_kinase_-_putative [Leishmania major strain Friedlin]CBZ12151.1 putative phosphatidylinositol (3,5) kinase [Leishmania major strain Friedlin]|eukprot:XP_003721895.1 putative phosphatidylinositol (3,5) kinase [Leishmania major strain Friedlin]
MRLPCPTHIPLSSAETHFVGTVAAACPLGLVRVGVFSLRQERIDSDTCRGSTSPPPPQSSHRCIPVYFFFVTPPPPPPPRVLVSPELKMPTDRSLWVEDKYALRCRGCGKKFTAFRRRHHCRRCGQVFCYECLHPLSTAASTPQNIVFSVYQWFSSSPATPLSTPTSPQARKTTEKTEVVSSSRDGAAAAAGATAAAAELSMRLCCRCAATIAENAAREASLSHDEFEPSSLPVHSTAPLGAKMPPPLMPSVSLPCPPLSKVSTPMRLSERSLPEEEPSPAPPRTPPFFVTARQSEAEDPHYMVAPELLGSTAMHAETAEEREVTYSIGRVRRPPPSVMTQWRRAHQEALTNKEARAFPVQRTSPCASALESAGALVRTLSGHADFHARFFLGEDVTQSPSDPNDGVMGSAAVIPVADAPAPLRGFLNDFGAACTTHLEARIQHTLQSSFPNLGGSRLCCHLADVAWHIVSHTAVALDASILDHLSSFFIHDPAQPAQCIVYPGLVNRRRLPSKRAMSPCDHPRVLLLAGHLSYPVQPTEDLVEYVRSYSGYLDKLFQRLVMWHPDVIVVEGGMHHYLRARIEQEGQMRLMLDVGRDFLVQLSWCLRADIIADLQYVGVGDLATTAPLGHCTRFEVLELAEEVRCCGFRGFDALSYHTLILRGGSPSGGVVAHDSSNGERQWETMEKVVREAVAVAYHLALQAHGAAALVRKDLPVSVSGAAPTAEEAAAAAAITMNLGCHFPSSVQSACRDAASPAALSALKDSIVVNIVHMDELFEGGAGGGGGGAVVSTLAKSRSTELSLERGSSRGSLTLFQGGSHHDLPASGAASASSSAPLLSPPLGRAEAPAANAYAVVQQKSALTFYGAGDESLFHFLVNRCAGTESQMLYLHGAHRVKVTTSISPPLPSAAAILTESGLAGVLGAAQMLAFHKVTSRQSAARALAAAEPLDTHALAAFVAHLKGYFSLRIRVMDEDARVAAADAVVVAAAPVDAVVEVCEPHLLNLSTAAFLEWVLYGWIPALSRRFAQPNLQLHFQFHSLGTAAQPQEPGAINVSAYANAVTFLVEAVSLSRIEYARTMMPRADPAPQGEGSSEGDAMSIVDCLYARDDAEEMESLLAELQQVTRTSLDRMDQLENAKAGVPAAASPVGAAHVPEDAEGKAAAAARPSSMPTLERSTRDLRQLSEDVQHALSLLHDARQRGHADVVLLLANMRSRLLPALLAAYRGWHVAQRRATTKSPATTPTDAAAATAAECPSCLRQLDGCLYHKERAQWIRLAEPSSILAAALLHLYRPLPPSTLCIPSTTKGAAAGTELELNKPVDSEAAAAASATPHGAFAVKRTHTASSLDASPATRSGQPPLLSMVSQLSPTEALEVLRQSSRSDAALPTSLKCTLSGYQSVVHLGVGGPAGLAGGAVATLSSAASVASMIGGGSGNAEPTITVDVLFPLSFAALHVLYTDGAPFHICAALVRCRPFSTDGGKSHSKFFVTQDGRFLIKSVKPMELRHFREWAPRYFARMEEHYTSLQRQQQQQQQQPSDGETCAHLFEAQSTLGKIMGLYAVHVQGSRSRASTSPATSSGAALGDATPQLWGLLTDGTHYFMVVEQLLFQRPVREKWDLKGSQRNRTTEHTAAVRLDVDLVQERLRLGNFFFCTPEAKSLLMDHLSRDTALLADSGIMDYSLMVSVGDGSVCVGIIDFLHPYSSAKVLESKMKSSLDTMLGYTRRDPTIIDPASYAARFMRWMDGYFNGVPDRLFPLTSARQRREDRESGVVEKRPRLPPLFRETTKRQASGGGRGD